MECFVALPFLMGLSILVMTILLIAAVKLVTDDPYSIKASFNELFQNLKASLLFAKFIIIPKKCADGSISMFNNKQQMGFLIDPINDSVISIDQINAPRYVILPGCVLSIEGLVSYYVTKKRIDTCIIHPLEKDRFLTMSENKRIISALSHFFSCLECEIESVIKTSLDKRYEKKLGDTFSSCQKLYRLHHFYEQIAQGHPRFEPLSLLKTKDCEKIRNLSFKAKRVLLTLMPKLNII
jgi:hypothetical protein